MRVLLLKENDRWVAQGLEYDITASGVSIAEAKAAFRRMVEAQVAGAEHDGIEPFEGIGPAPDFYHELAERAEPLKNPMPPPAPTMEASLCAVYA